jgi:hypothetical protein
MTFGSTAPRNFSPILAVLAGLVCVQGACSLRSVDYLKNGHRQDGAARDNANKDGGIPSSSDAASFDAVRLDALSSDGVGGTDGLGGENLGAGMTDGTTSGGEADSGTADGTALDGNDDVFVGGLGDARGEKAMGMETREVSIDGMGDIGVSDTAPRIDGATLDSPNRDVANFDGPPADGVLLDSPIPDSLIPDSLIADSPIQDSSIPDSPPPRPSALFVVGAIPLGSGDAAIQTRLTGKGYDVTLVKDTNLTSVTTVTATVILISHTATPGDVTTKFRDTARPVMVCQSSIFANMGLTDGALLSQGSSLLSYSSLVINSAAGELAAGLSGTISVLQSSANLNYGVPNNQALTVASFPGLSGYWAIFAYDTGAQMYNLAAPARRVGFFLGANNATDLTANGWLLFDAALTWLAK